MITDLDLVGEELTYTSGGVNTVIPFATITASDEWTTSGLIKLELTGGQTVGLQRNSFMDNLAFNSPTERGAEFYEQDTLTYMLYRILEGEIEADVQDEIDNLVAQRELILADKTAWKDGVNAQIVEWTEIDANNQAVIVAQSLVDNLNIEKAAIDDAIAIYINDGGIQYIPSDPESDIALKIDQITKLNETIIFFNDELTALNVTLTSLNSQIAYLEGQPNYANLPDLQAQVAALVIQVSDTEDLITDKEQDITDATNTRIFRESEGKDILDAMLVDVTAERDDAQDALDALDPYDDTIGDGPEITPLDFRISVQMRKLYYVVTVVEGGWSNPTFADVEVADIAAYEGTYGTIIIS